MFSVLTMAVAVSFLYVGPGPLVPALNSYWIKIHVQAAIWRIVALCPRRDRHDPVPRAGPARAPERSTGSAPKNPRRSWAARSTWTLRTTWWATPPTRRRLPSPGSGAACCRGRHARPDRLSVIAFAFPIWTFAVIAGAIWAQEAWGRYWGWDPKETWSFITWTIFAGYLHARSTSGWSGRKAAVIALVGFVALLDHVLRREPVDRRAALLRQVSGWVAGPQIPRWYVRASLPPAGAATTPPREETCGRRRSGSSGSSPSCSPSPPARRTRRRAPSIRPVPPRRPRRTSSSPSSGSPSASS